MTDAADSARQIALVARGVRSDVEREEARLAPILAMTVTKWGMDIRDSVASAYPAAQQAAIKAAVNEDAIMTLHKKLVEKISDSYRNLVQCTNKTVAESAASLTRINEVAVAAPNEEGEPTSPKGLPPPTSAPATPVAAPPPAEPASPPPPARHTRKAVRVLVDHATMTDGALHMQEAVLMDRDTQTEQVGSGAARRVFEAIRHRLAAKRLTAAVSKAASERLVLVQELIRLMAVAKDAAVAITEDCRVLVAGQLQSWREGVDKGTLSEPTVAALASLDSGALRIIAARASGKEDTCAEEMADALSRPAFRRYPDAPRARVRMATKAVSVVPADLLPALPVKDVTVPPKDPRDALKSRERARIGESSFFLCRRCGENAREYRFDPATKRLVRSTATTDGELDPRPRHTDGAAASARLPSLADPSRGAGAASVSWLPEISPGSKRRPHGGGATTFESQFFGSASPRERPPLQCSVDWGAASTLVNSTKAGHPPAPPRGKPSTTQRPSS